MSAISIPTIVVSRPTNFVATRTFVTPFRLFVPFREHDYISYAGAPALHPNAGGERRIDPVCRKVVEHIFGVEGVDSVVVRPFEIDITIAGAFDWEDLDVPLKFLITSADPILKDVKLTAPQMDFMHYVIWDGNMMSHDLRHYALTVRLFAPKHNLDTKRHYPPARDAGRQPLTKEGDALIRQLSEINGLAHVNLDPFQLNVCKYGDYSWDELHEQILDALSDCFPDDVTVQLRRARH